MARRHRRRHRRYGDYVSVPLGFGKMKLPNLKSLNPLGKHVNTTDLIVGAFVTLAGGVFIKKGLDRFWPTAPAFVQQYGAPLSTLLAGATAFIVLKNKARATGWFAGSVMASLVPLGWAMVQSKVTALQDYTSIQYGYPVDVGPMGLLVNESKPSLSAMAGFAMGDEDDSYAFAP